MEDRNRIPKIIHYCWLSGDEMPQKVKDCLDSWKAVMPDYELKLWSMDNFDIHSVPWVEQACSVKKWAFAADYIRLYALYHEGGIYLDSDVRAIKSFDPYLKHRGFTGVEWNQKEFLCNYTPKNTGINIEFACIGAEKGHPLIKEFMSYYEDRDFIIDEKRWDMDPMPFVMNPIAARNGFDNRIYWSPQVLEGDFHVYPYDFCPGRSHIFFEEPRFNHNTVAFHLHHTSWATFKMEGRYRKVHSPFTEFKLYLKAFIRNVRDDVFLRKGYIGIEDKQFKKVGKGR